MKTYKMKNYDITRIISMVDDDKLLSDKKVECVIFNIVPHDKKRNVKEIKPSTYQIRER